MTVNTISLQAQLTTSWSFRYHQESKFFDRCTFVLSWLTSPESELYRSKAVSRRPEASPLLGLPDSHCDRFVLLPRFEYGGVEIRTSLTMRTYLMRKAAEPCHL